MSTTETTPKSTELKAGIDTHKRTTKVNLAVAIGVLLFFIAGAFVFWHTRQSPPETPEQATPFR